MKQLIIFDLDGTLAESKAAIDDEMAKLLCHLLDVVKVAIISGGGWPQFKKQVLWHLPKKNLTNLNLLPACGTKYYQYKSGWIKLYSEDFTKGEKYKIIGGLDKAIPESGLKVEKTWGQQIEDRGSQITFSALGQQAPVEEKKKWDADFAKRKKIKILLDKSLPEFSVEMGGATSIDITKHGIDKAYGIKKLEQKLGVNAAEIIFIGDALFEGGNDHPAIATGVACIQVRDAGETKRVIETIIACLEKV
jgi:HAD superfamily hydrolase (TIGR01484 family)